jgi:hypothetical protein
MLNRAANGHRLIEAPTTSAPGGYLNEHETTVGPTVLAATGEDWFFEAEGECQRSSPPWR